MGDLEQIYRPDIITEADDAENEIGVHDPVIALHPSFPYAYAPGTTVMKIYLCSLQKYMCMILGWSWTLYFINNQTLFDYLHK